MVDQKLLSILACPACKGPLHHHRARKELWCLADKLAFEIRDDIPVMLIDEARRLSLEELDGYAKK